MRIPVQAVQIYFNMRKPVLDIVVKWLKHQVKLDRECDVKLITNVGHTVRDTASPTPLCNCVSGNAEKHL